MANTIAYATQYVNNYAEIQRMYRTNLLSIDLFKPVVEHKGQTISYDMITFASNTMGNYSRSSGYSAKDFTLARKTATLTQDKGDVLSVDKMDAEEGQLADGIISVFNVYTIKVALPTIDAYVFGKFAAKYCGNETVNASITSANILSKLLADKAAITGRRIRFEECIIYISSSAKALLDEATLGKGYITIGNWNGNLDAEVELFKGAKVVEVPDDTLGSNVNWVMVHPLAFDAFFVYEETVVRTDVPGFGHRKAQVEVGEYFDAWAVPSLNDSTGGTYLADGIQVDVKTARA